MMRIATLLALALTMAPPDKLGPIRVTIDSSSKPYLVGRAIELKVEVEPAPASFTVEPPRSPDFDLFPMPSDPARPSTSRFVAVPRRAGTLELTPFRARIGEKLATSKPIRLVVANVPAEGRTSTFLGGVGPFDARAEAEPNSVRLGGTLEFRVNLIGEAAWGSVRKPDPSEWSGSSLKIEPLPDLFRATEQPVRSFLYRVRPLTPGPLVLPPISVAAYDPTIRRYVTKATSSVTIRVEEPPRFDPSGLIFPPPRLPARISKGRMVGVVSGASAVVIGSALAAWSVARRRKRSANFDPRKLARELSSGLRETADPEEDARAVVGALTTFLHRVGRRPLGALTPWEARAGFEEWTGDAGRAAVAEALVERCDRVLYGYAGRPEAGIIAEGRGFFEGLAGMASRGGPGEAVETASES